jgi:hypothetical protein
MKRKSTDLVVVEAVVEALVTHRPLTNLFLMFTM